MRVLCQASQPLHQIMCTSGGPYRSIQADVLFSLQVFELLHGVGVNFKHTLG